jgi:hypothetical protein
MHALLNSALLIAPEAGLAVGLSRLKVSVPFTIAKLYGLEAGV